MRMRKRPFSGSPRPPFGLGAVAIYVGIRSTRSPGFERYWVRQRDQSADRLAVLSAFAYGCRAPTIAQSIMGLHEIDPLEAIQRWLIEPFHADIEAVVLTPEEANKSKADSAFDAIVMFRMWCCRRCKSRPGTARRDVKRGSLDLAFAARDREHAPGCAAHRFASRLHAARSRVPAPPPTTITPGKPLREPLLRGPRHSTDTACAACRE